jgi:hypothetical protein
VHLPAHTAPPCRAHGLLGKKPTAKDFNSSCSGSDPDQTRPRTAEAADLVTHGLRQRAGIPLPPGRRPLDWERAHAKFMIPFRLVFALVLFIISAIIVAAHNGQLWSGELWLLLTVPGMLVHLWIVYRIRPSTTHR